MAVVVCVVSVWALSFRSGMRIARIDEQADVTRDSARFLCLELFEGNVRLEAEHMTHVAGRLDRVFDTGHDRSVPLRRAWQAETFSGSAPSDLFADWVKFGFIYSSRDDGDIVPDGFGERTHWYRSLVIPRWVSLGFPLTLFCVLSVIVVRRWRRRFGPGKCQRCGYDLRANASEVSGVWGGSG